MDERGKSHAERALRVLLAEDDTVNAVVATTMLARLGHDVVRVENGAQALARLREDDFDLALIDVRMPVMDGLEVVRSYRAERADRPSRTPVVTLTANALEGDEAACLAAGADGYLSKPIDLASLRATVTRFGRAPRTFDRAAFEARMEDARIARDVARTYIDEWPTIERAIAHAQDPVDWGALADSASALHVAALTVSGDAAVAAARALAEASRLRDPASHALATRAIEAGEALRVALETFAPS